MQGSFKIFDLCGIQHRFEKCVLVTITNIQNLVVYFHAFSPEGISQFELKGVETRHVNACPTFDQKELIPGNLISTSSVKNKLSGMSTIT